MSTTIELINFDKKLAAENFDKLLSGNRDFIDTLGSPYQLRDQIEELGAGNDADFSIVLVRMIYVYCGSLSSIIVASPVGEYDHLDIIYALTDHYKLPMESDIPTKAGFIDLYSRISDKDISEIALQFSEDNDYDFEDGKAVLIDTLKYLRSFVISLKNNSTSDLVISIDHDIPDVLPEDINEYIIDRIEKAGSIEDLAINITTQKE